MAAKARKSSAKSVKSMKSTGKTSGKRTGASRTSASRVGGSRAGASIAAMGDTRKKDPVSIEITGVIIIAVSIFLILGIYTEDKAGKIGTFFKMGFVGMFGFGAYIFPLIVIAVCLYVLFSRSKSVMPKTFIAAGVLFITVVTAVHVIYMEEGLEFENIGEYLGHYFLNSGMKNGGLLGAIFGNFLVGVFSHVGTYIIIFSSVIVCLIALTGKSFFSGLAHLVSTISDFFTFVDYDEEYEDEYEYEEEPVNTKPVRKPEKKLEKKESPRKSEAEPAVKQTEVATAAKDPSAYTFEIKGAMPSAERKVRLISEELSKDRRSKGSAVNLSGTSREDLPYRNQEKKRILEEQNKPSVKFDMKGKMPRPETEKEITTDIRLSDTADTVLSDASDIILSGVRDAASSDMPDTVFSGVQDTVLSDMPDTVFGGAHDTVLRDMPDTDFGGALDTIPSDMWDIVDENDGDYGDDILFNSAPAYEDVPEEHDSNTTEKKEPKPEKFIESKVFEYVFPPIDLLNVNPNDASTASKAAILENSKKLEDALKSFKVEAKVMEVNVGPTVTRYELSPGVGVKVSAISNLADDLALNLAAAGIRIEAPIPGKAAVGIEVPNKEAQPVFLREVISDSKFKAFPSKLAFALGKDIAGNVVIADIAKMPHMLIAGSTGSGKSVCINTLVSSIIYKSRPEDVKLLMVDPKVVELKVYNGIPHLLIPVVTDPKKAAGALNWAVREMTSRYGLFADTSVRDLKGYNQLLTENGEETIPQIVIIIDELADLMMTAGKEVEEYICRLAQMARAAGIHLIIATQRPSVDVITGLIKANIPSKIAFAVSSSIDSRTILGEGGAEKLLGRGDMLFYPTGMSKPLRVQGSFISDKEVEAVVSFVKQGASVEYDEKVIENITSTAGKTGGDSADSDEDEFMEPAIEFIVKKEKASASLLQRQFRIGYNRASRIIEILEERGIVGAEDGSKPRKVLMSKFEWEDYQNRRRES